MPWVLEFKPEWVPYDHGWVNSVLINNFYLTIGPLSDGYLEPNPDKWNDWVEEMFLGL